MSTSRVEAALAQLGVTYRVVRHAPVGSLAEAAEARGIPPHALIKTMVVRRAADDYLLVLVPGDRAIAWPRLRALLGVSRLSMPDADTAFAVTGYRRGTITPLGTTTPLPVVADSRIAGEISIGGGDHGVGVTLKAETLLSALDATVADVTEPAPGDPR
jgi:Cys-tRNA(Pro)/Cys-tRNA(Cys) deacylase